MNTNKKVVRYNSVELFVGVGCPMFLTPVDHPDSERVSNTGPVRTSNVVSYDEATETYETLNTVYVPA